MLHLLQVAMTAVTTVTTMTTMLQARPSCSISMQWLWLPVDTCVVISLVTGWTTLWSLHMWGRPTWAPLGDIRVLIIYVIRWVIITCDYYKKTTFFSYWTVSVLVLQPRFIRITNVLECSYLNTIPLNVREFCLKRNLKMTMHFTQIRLQEVLFQLSPAFIDFSMLQLISSCDLPGYSVFVNIA